MVFCSQWLQHELILSTKLHSLQDWFIEGAIRFNHRFAVFLLFDCARRSYFFNFGVCIFFGFYHTFSLVRLFPPSIVQPGIFPVRCTGRLHRLPTTPDSKNPHLLPWGYREDRNFSCYYIFDLF